MKIMILIADSNGGYPVPAVKGGAVSTLIEHFVDGNNKKQLCDMCVMSFYDKNAVKKATKKYPNINFIWIKVPVVFKLLDKCAFNFIKIVKKNEKAISFRSPFSLIYYIHKAKRISNKTDADKIVIENNVPLARVMKKNKFKGQWYYHFHNVPRIDAGCRKEFQKVAKFLCVSRYVACEISNDNSAIGRIDKNKTSVLYNCIDINRFKPIPKNSSELISIKKKYNIKDDEFIVVFTGRLSEEKGADVLLSALKKTPKNIRCLVVGGLLSGYNEKTHYQKKLIKSIEGLENRVIFTGYIKHEELPYYYNIADIAVLPSMWNEPAGLTNLEAMACGIPVITTNAGGIPEYLQDTPTQLERDDMLVNNIRNLIMMYYKYSDLKEEQGKKNSIFVKKRYDSRHYIDNLVNLLD